MRNAEIRIIQIICSKTGDRFRETFADCFFPLLRDLRRCLVGLEFGAVDPYGGCAFAPGIGCSLVCSDSCLHGNSGCLGCDKAKLASAYHETFKGQSNRFKETSKPVPSDDFWTTSPCGIDNSTNESTSLTLVNDPHSAGCSNNPSGFVNHGLLVWNQSRQKWIQGKRPKRQSRQLLEPKLSWKDTYDSVLGSNKRFRKPIPLSEMVDFLVEIWEQDGLYD